MSKNIAVLQMLDSEVKESSEDEVDFDYDDQNQKFFDIASVKPLDLKSQWLGNTNEVIKTFESGYKKLQVQQKYLRTNLKTFDQNQTRYKLSSLRQINLVFDRQVMYEEFMQKSRRNIELLHPSLLLNILSYAQTNTLLALAAMRRVSRIFNRIYQNQQVNKYFSKKYLGQQLPLPQQEQICQAYVNFTQTMLYYKAIHYSEQIPCNSIRQDLYKALVFMNSIYVRAYRLENCSIGYFTILKQFNAVHRVVLGLCSLALTSLVLIRREATVAYSNCLAYNQIDRQKEQVTKTKHSQIVKLMENFYYCDSLYINTTISNFLVQSYSFCFSVLIVPETSKIFLVDSEEFSVVYYCHHNQFSSFYNENILFCEGKAQVNNLELIVLADCTRCQISKLSQGRQLEVTLEGHYMPAVLNDNMFAECHVFRGENIYLILIKRTKTSR